VMVIQQCSPNAKCNYFEWETARFCSGGSRIIRRGYLKWWHAKRAAKFWGVPCSHPGQTPPLVANHSTRKLNWGEIPIHRT